MHIENSKIEQTVVLELKGRMDIIAAMQFEKTVGECLQRGEQKLVVNMAALDYISSAGLRSLLTSAKKIKAVQGKLHLCNVQGTVKEVFAMSGFDSILPIFNSLPEALPK